MRSLLPRIPLPITSSGAAATAGSIRSGQPAGNPSGVIQPYAIPVSSTAASIDANDAFRTSSRVRTTPFTSARVVASTRHAAKRSSPARFPATTTQFAEADSGEPYVSQKAAVSARSGSIAATPTSPGSGSDASALTTGSASSSGCSTDGSTVSEPAMLQV